MNRITVAFFSHQDKAEPVQKRLVANGVHAEVHDELRLEKLWYASKPNCGVRLEVPADEFERAEQLLLDWDMAEGALREAIRCPECKSLRIQYPAFAHKSVIPNVVMGFLARLGGVHEEYYCEDCHFTWPKEGTKASKLRPHMAPYYFIEGVEQSGLGGEQPRPESHRQAA